MILFSKSHLILTFSFLIAASQALLAATVNPSASPSDLIKLESLSVKCSEPGETCPRMAVEDIIDIVYLNVDDEYLLDDEIPQIATEEGLLVSYKISKAEVSEILTNEVIESEVKHRFFPMSKVQLSPDEDFYMCAKGQEFSVDFGADLTSIGLTEDKVSYIFSSGYEPTSFICKCFWAPKHVFDELGIEKYDKGTPKTDIIDQLIPESTIFTPQNTPNQTTTTSVPPVISIFHPDYPTYHPNHPTNPEPPPAPVGSPCGMFQFVCIYKLVTGSNE